MQNTISNTDDVIDSRDVIARIEELRDERPIPPSDDDTPEDKDIIGAATAEWESSEECAELAALEALQEEAQGYSPDWTYGSQLIRDEYFETYAEQLAEDIGAVDKHQTWPNNYIDWKEAAEQLQQDYTSVEFDGVTYWVR